MALPLDGIRAVEVANYVAVPAAGAILADLGARVIKVEPPPRGEMLRRSKPRYAGYVSEFPEGPAFHMENRGKDSLLVDLTRPEAREVLLRLIDTADIFLTNLLPSRRRRFGLDAETLHGRRPELIFAALNGYGSRGEQADWPAFDYTAYWARTGMMDLMRDEGSEPAMQRPGIGDHAAASNLVCGILAALRMRDRDGRGRSVEVSLLQTGLHVLGNDLAVALVTGEPVRRHDPRHPPNPLWNRYRTGDDRWLLLVMIEPDRYFERVFRAIGRDDVAGDPRYREPFERMAHAEELARILSETFATRSLEEWAPRLDAAGVIWAPMARIEDAIRDPQARANGYFHTLEHPDAGRFETLGAPFRIDGVPIGPRRAIGPPGARAREILAEAGIDPSEAEKLT